MAPMGPLNTLTIYICIYISYIYIYIEIWCHYAFSKSRKMGGIARAPSLWHLFHKEGEGFHPLLTLNHKGSKITLSTRGGSDLNLPQKHHF